MVVWGWVIFCHAVTENLCRPVMKENFRGGYRKRVEHSITEEKIHAKS